MLGYEEEIESLNANLDAKNDFISALQDEIRDKNNETKCFLSQLDNRASVIKQEGKNVKNPMLIISFLRLMEQELKSLRYKSRFGKVCILSSSKNNILSSILCLQRKSVSNKGVGTESDSFDMLKVPLQYSTHISNL